MIYNKYIHVLLLAFTNSILVILIKLDAEGNMNNTVKFLHLQNTAASKKKSYQLSEQS